MQAARGASLSPEHEGPDAITSPARGVRATFVAVAVLGLAVDVVTKILAVEHLTAAGRIDLIGDLFGLRLTRNPGAAFSTGTGFTWIFSLLACVATVVVLWLSRRLRTSLAWAVALGAILAGVTGNLSDRLFRSPGPFHGHVIDFLQLPNWPIFNIADVLLNVGVGLVVLQSFRGIAIDGTREADER